MIDAKQKAFGIRKKEKDNDSTGSPDRDGGSQKKTNGAPNGFYGDIDWDRYNSPEVDDEGYSIRPEDETEETHFFSSDESEEEEDHRKKFKIKIKPLPADCVVSEPSVDELKASIGNIALSPSPMVSSSVLILLSLHLTFPHLNCFLTCETITFINSHSPHYYCSDIVFCLFCFFFTGSSSPVRPATPSSVNPTPPPPPPRPPSRPKLPPGKPTVGDANRPFSPPIHSASPPPIAPLARAESTSSISSTNSLSAATTPTVNKELPSLVWFDRGKFYLTFEGCSRGPSPLTMGAQDTLPVAAAFTETVNAFFKGADPNKCVVKIIGEMVLSFPAGITRHFANNPSPAVLTFSITNYSRLEHVLPNPQLLCCDTTTQAKADAKDFWVNMPNLISHLKKVAEQKPQATYYNVDMLKYQVSVQGLQSTPLNLAVSWRCEPTSTDLRIDYKYNGEAMSTPMALNNVQFLVPVDGGVSKLQAVLPPAAWNTEQQRILWKIPDISQKSENGGVGSLLARFQLTEGPSKPAPLAVQFTSEGTTLSGCDIELAGPGYRFSLVKKRFAAGQFSCSLYKREFTNMFLMFGISLVMFRF
uniref:SH3-containing GRB2-like protein 3-interacting protein 1 n=1 Tax=Sphaeramia orbicularis TaxID=375764 RepID=A0A672Y356_9TELE